MGSLKHLDLKIDSRGDVGIAGSPVSNDSDWPPRIEHKSLVVHVTHVSIQECTGLVKVPMEPSGFPPKFPESMYLTKRVYAV